MTEKIRANFTKHGCLLGYIKLIEIAAMLQVRSVSKGLIVEEDGKLLLTEKGVRILRKFPKREIVSRARSREVNPANSRYSEMIYRLLHSD